MNNFQQQYSQYQSEIEEYLNSKCIIYPNEPQQILFESMRYSLLAGGKRLRPILALDFCRMSGGNWRDAIPFAASVEMIHTYSLIHDDLPCMDNDDYRRGRLTNHKVYGEAMAVLAGDALLTTAFSQIANANLPAATRIAAIDVLSQCSGEKGMVGGQVLDILSEERQCTEEEIVNIESRKTGALIRAACVLGVLAGQGSAEQVDAATVFADHLGLAFQIRDDMLDVIGNAEDLGKAVGVDSTKNTYVRLYGLEKCDVLVKEHTNLALDALQLFSEHNFSKQLALQLTNRNK